MKLKKEMVKSGKSETLRSVLFTKCESKEHLSLWIKNFLGLDLPDGIICGDDETHAPSNSSPMDLVWELYSKGLDGTDERFQKVLAYASRDSYKCCEKGTLILTDKGLKTIENIKIGDIVWSGHKWCSVTNWIHDGVKESVSLVLKNGLSLTVSPVHKVWAWSKGKVPEWKKVSELTSDDLVCVDTNHRFADNKDINQEEFEIGYLCGVKMLNFAPYIRTKSYIVGLISGILSTDKCIVEKQRIKIKVSNEEVLKLILVTLCSLGVNAFLEKNFKYIVICKNDVLSLLEKGVQLPINKKKCFELKRPQRVSVNKWVSVINVFSGKADFYDLTVENDHSYWSNGIISHNTICASVFEILCLFHLERNVVHMAAVESQSAKSASYLESYFQRPVLKDYLTSKNKRTIEITWYRHNKTGKDITPKEYEDLNIIEKEDYTCKSHYMKIIVATMQGSNSEHASAVVLDELDLAPPKPVEEAKMIPCVGFHGELPITLMISSRKFAFGLVQKEIDKSENPKSNIQVRHWNVLDVSKPCPAKRHLPELPQINVFYDEATLNCIPEEDWKILAPEEKVKYLMTKGYQGCLKNCPLFAACKGRLATNQKGTSKLLKPLEVVIGTFNDLSLETKQAQLLCWKPSSTGLIYPHFSRAKHVATVEKIMNMIDTEPVKRATKSELINLLIRRGFTFHLGMDFGFTHNFATVFGASDGHRLFILDAFAIANVELNEKIELCKNRYLPYNPMVYPDPAYPSDIKSFKKAGFRCKRFDKDVLLGIDAVRGKLAPGMNKEPEMFFLDNDIGVVTLIKEISQYHWMLDANGNPTDEPDKENDDLCFTSDTEVLTKNGWVSLANVKETNEVLAVTDTGEGIWENPQAVIKKEFTGDFYNINHKHLEFSATSDHLHSVMTQMSVKKNKTYLLEKRTIDDMCSEMYWANNISKWESGPGLFPQGADEAWMAGFWLAEGCFDTGRPSFLIVDQKKLQHQKTVRETATRLGWVWSETDREDGMIRFVFSGQGERAIKWKEMFNQYSHDKRILIEDILKMTVSEREALWEGYMAGDGCRTNSSWHFDSVSKELIEGMQIITLMLGYGCRVVSYNCMREGRACRMPSGKICLSKKIYRAHVLRKKPIAHIQKSRFEKEYKENVMVYCIRTSTGHFLARTNGKPFVAGNCDALRYLCQNLFGKFGKFIVGEEEKVKPKAIHKDSRSDWMRKTIDGLTEGNEQPIVSGKRGSFKFSI